jgi:protein phosphatase 4 regulatory subunit 3
VWTEANVTDMALSFQEAEGCAAIWEFVNDAQQRFGGVGEDGFSDEGIDTMLPNPDLGNLTEVENIMRMANNSMASRDALAKYIAASDYIGKLVPLVDMAEDLESLSDLHRLCNIMKTIILLNDQNVMDRVVSDDWWMGVIGALECKTTTAIDK